MEMRKTRLLLIRHGETDWNVNGCCQGQRDVPLNEKGKGQALKLAHYLEDVSIDVIYSSDLSRAWHTAEGIAKTHGLELKGERGLRERYYGEWEGLFHKDIAVQYPDQMEARKKGGMYGIEAYDDLQKRIIRTLTVIAEKHFGETVIAVSHGGAINAFLYWHTSGKMGTGITFIENTSVTELQYSEDGTWELADVNQIRHLEGR